MLELPVFAYDEVPYSGAVEAEAHPRYLEAIAMLRGMRPAAIDSCRVLELGCASGRTLLQLAQDFPGSEFVGIELAADRIGEATDVAREIGLRNVDFRHGSLTEVDESWGTFDYILCLGVLSWVPRDIQDDILRLLSTNLTPRGIAAVTYKTFPGWHHLNIVRDALRYHTNQSSKPSERIRNARTMLAFLASETQPRSLQGQIYRDDNEYLQAAQDDYLFHDYLTDDSHPFYFHEFFQRVSKYELRYLGETNFSRNNLPPDASAARAALANQPLVERCQMLDFLNNTAYRKSILCRADVELTELIDPRRLKTLLLSLREIPEPARFDITSTAVQSFTYESGSLNVAAPFGKAALRYLLDTHPRPMSIRELCRGANALLPDAMRVEGDRGEDLLAGAMLGSLEAGLIQACHRAPEFVQTISNMPVATPLARALAKRGSIVANRCHQNVRLSDDAVSILPQLNGENGHDVLLRYLASHSASELQEDSTTAKKRLDAALAELRDRAFLVA